MATNVREHLAHFHAAAHEHHKTAAAHHDSLSEHHAELAKHFHSMAKAAGKPDGDTYQALGEAHGAAAKAHAHYSKSHSDFAAFHAEAADGCEKAEQDRLGKTLVPDRFSSVIPTNVPEEGFGIRGVIRPGQPDLNKAEIDRIHPRFRHLVEIGEA